MSTWTACRKVKRCMMKTPEQQDTTQRLHNQNQIKIIKHNWLIRKIEELKKQRAIEARAKRQGGNTSTVSR